jgi:single-strand selective monofunctional uracil DNA glycosylase
MEGEQNGKKSDARRARNVTGQRVMPSKKSAVSRVAGRVHGLASQATTTLAEADRGLVEASRRLARAVARLSFAPPVAYVYNPLAYARTLHESYLCRYGQAPKDVLLLGMNPGPFGMAQTGIPFGDVAMVRDFLGLHGDVGRPAVEHAKRPVLGFACPRCEVSGSRLWGWARQTFGTPEAFFARFFVANYCPLAFMEGSGKNLTPDKLPAAEREPLFAACDEALRATVAALRPRYAVGVGGFASARLQAVLAGSAVVVGTILHPSPASPAANRGWADQVMAQLAALGIRLG